MTRTLGRELPTVSYIAGSGRSFVVTTYLDTAGLDYTTLAERSAGNRSIKVRVREYIALFADGTGAVRLGAAPTCYFERKERVGQIRVKQRIELPKTELAGILRREVPLPGDDEVVTALRGELDRRALEPVLITGYRRLVFGYDGGLRVTLDEGIEFFRPHAELYEETSALTPSVLGSPAGRGPDYILEVKEVRGQRTPAWLEHLLGDLEPADEFSKFREGIRCLASPIRRARRATSS